MSIESLITKDPGFTQKACHDLKLFLYIILYLCTFTNGPDLVLSKEVPTLTPMHSWFNNNADPSATSFLKAGHMLCPDLSILPYITRYWEDLKPYVLRLIETCFPENPGQPNHLMHNKMVSILREAFEAAEEPQKTRSKRSLPLASVFLQLAFSACTSGKKREKWEKWQV
jgi:hypothetical protein